MTSIKQKNNHEKIGTPFRYSMLDAKRIDIKMLKIWAYLRSSNIEMAF